MLVDSPDLILNLSASSDTISSRQARRFMMKGISERKKCPYLYVSGSTGESTSISLLNNIHLVYSGNNDLERYFSSDKELTTSIKIDIDSIRSQGNHKGLKNLTLMNKSRK